MIEERIQNDLILFDRGYSLVELFTYLIDNKISFLMRTAKNYSKDIINAKKNHQIIRIIYKSKTYKLRVLRLMVSSGQEKILVSNLEDEKYTIQDFKELYFLRWGIETKYDELKNKMEIENFTGTTKIAIGQDFYTTIYLSNMAELARKQSNEIVIDNIESKDNKYEYKTNTTILIGTLRDKFILLLLEKNKRKRYKQFDDILEKISKSVLPIRPNRHYERLYRRTRGKYKLNRKICL